MSLFNYKIKYVVGIDADITKCGLGVYSRPKRALVYCRSVTFVELLSNLDKLEPGTAIFRVDAGWKNGGFHHEAGLPENFKDWNVEAKLAYYFKLGVQCGRNFGVGQIICQLLVNKHGPDNVYEIQPNKKTKKLKDEYFRKVTGWQYTTNQDARDAGMLCFGF